MSFWESSTVASGSRIADEWYAATPGNENAAVGQNRLSSAPARRQPDPPPSDSTTTTPPASAAPVYADGSSRLR